MSVQKRELSFAETKRVVVKELEAQEGREQMQIGRDNRTQVRAVSPENSKERQPEGSKTKGSWKKQETPFQSAPAYRNAPAQGTVPLQSAPPLQTVSIPSAAQLPFQKERTCAECGEVGHTWWDWWVCPKQNGKGKGKGQTFPSRYGPTETEKPWVPRDAPSAGKGGKGKSGNYVQRPYPPYKSGTDLFVQQREQSSSRATSSSQSSPTQVFVPAAPAPPPQK